MASPEEQVLHNPHLVLSILRYVTPADLLRVQRVSCIFRQAASHTTWNGHLAATFGHSSQRPQGSFKDMITLDGVTGLSGWCEDHCVSTHMQTLECAHIYTHVHTDTPSLSAVSSAKIWPARVRVAV